MQCELHTHCLPSFVFQCHPADVSCPLDSVSGAGPTCHSPAPVCGLPRLTALVRAPTVSGDLGDFFSRLAVYGIPPSKVRELESVII